MTEALMLGGPGDPLAEVWTAVREAADATPAYAVGGPVRDLLRGHPHEDADVAVEGDAVPVARRLASALAGARLTLHPAFGTAVVRAGRLRIDVAATRRERYPAPGSLPEVEPAGIEEDLGRRDFTVNALAAALTGHRFGELLDPFHGRADIDAGVIRVLHPGSFRDDPTRLFRAIRYASRLGYRLEPRTDGWAREAIAGGMVATLSGARVKAEVVALLGESTVTVAAALTAADARGLLAAVEPSLAGAAAEGVPRVARLDGLRVRFAPRAPAWRVRLAAVAAGAGEAGVGALAGRLRLRRRDAAVVRAAAAAPGTLGPRLAAAATPADVGDLLDPVPVEAALVIAAAGEDGAREAAVRYLERIRGVRLEIDGGVLRDELGLGQSPLVGRVLAELLRRKRNGALPDRASEVAAARGLMRDLVGKAAT